VIDFIGVLEVVDKPYKDSPPIWTDEDFPCRLKVKVAAELEPDIAVPVLELREKLSLFENLASPQAWMGRFRESPTKWDTADAEAVVAG